MKPAILYLGLGIAMVLACPFNAQAAKAKIIRIFDCRAASATGLTREHGVTVYRAAARPWQTAAQMEKPAAPAPRKAVRPYRYNYLAVDTRSHGEWGPVNAVYQKF